MDPILFIDIIGTFVFAISGVSVAVDKQFDFFGTIILAFVTAIGGGTLRDVLIGSTPVGWMSSSLHIWVILSALPVAYFFSKQLKHLRTAFWLFDTIGIGLFTVFGVQKSLSFGVSPTVAVMMGVVSAVFGGILRDVLSNEVPLIFRKEVYAFACLSGALIFLLMEQISSVQLVNLLVSIATVIVIRLLAIRNQWSIPFNPIDWKK